MDADRNREPSGIWNFSGWFFVLHQHRDPSLSDDRFDSEKNCIKHYNKHWLNNIKLESAHCDLWNGVIIFLLENFQFEKDIDESAEDSKEKFRFFESVGVWKSVSNLNYYSILSHNNWQILKDDNLVFFYKPNYE